MTYIVSTYNNSRWKLLLGWNLGRKLLYSYLKSKQRKQGWSSGGDAFTKSTMEAVVERATRERERV